MPRGRVDRRRFLRGAGSAGALGGAALLGGRQLSRAETARAATPELPDPRLYCQIRTADGTPSANMVVGSVDHSRNGFDPYTVLTDFDGGEVSRDRNGRTVREYEINAVPREIEVAPGVFFPAWTYNGRVPGPTIRATQGDRIVIRFGNGNTHPHTMHFHGFHGAGMDGVPGAGEVYPGETTTYDFVAEPFGTHLYHCHSLPVKEHIHRGLYGAFIVDPPGGRPPANELLLMMNAFDTNFDGANEVYAVNTVAFAYAERPIQIRAGELQRAHVINVTEFDPINSIHLHANFFDVYRSGTSLQPTELVDVLPFMQAERHMIEFTYREPGRYMFHAHQAEFIELGWMSFFEVS